MLTPNEFDLTIHVQNLGAKFEQNRVRIATTGKDTDRQTDRQTDASDFITSMQCSNGIVYKTNIHYF